MWDDTITVFNRYEASDGEILYYPTVINGVDLIVDNAAAQATTGLADADEARLHIPYTVQNGSIMVGGKKWLPPIAWAGQVNDDLSTSVTFDEGNDFFMLGIYPQTEEPISSDDYSRTGFLDYLRLTYDDVYLIASVGKYDLIPHFEIGGR